MQRHRWSALLIAALALTGCVSQSPGVGVEPAPMARPDLDTLAYGVAPPPVVLPPPNRTRVARVYHPVAPVAVAAASVAMARGFAAEEHHAYTLDSGDKLRIVVFGQDSLSNTYLVGASGAITMPLIGSVPARGLTPHQLSASIATRLKNGYIREPSVAVEIDTYRPFFVLGEVTYPGQYPYVPNMSVEAAVAIAGGFTPRAYKTDVTVTRKFQGLPTKYKLPMQGTILPGDTVTVSERWF